MRTTVTLDPDTEQLLRRQMSDKKISFKRALNDAVRAALSSPGEVHSFRTETASMGESQVDLDRALQLAAQLEDDDTIRKMRAGS